MKINIKFENGFTAKERLRIEQAVAIASEFFGSGELSARLLDSEPTQTDKSTKEILDEIRSTQLVLITVYKWRPFWGSFSSAIAIESNGKIGLASRFFKLAFSENVGTIAHEVTHTLGFSHSFYYSLSRNKSVPYLIGDWASEYAKRTMAV